MRKALEKLTAAWAVAGGVVLLVIVGVTVTNIGAFALDRVARVFGTNVSALPGYEDFVRLAIGAAVPMFLPWCQMQRGHLAVDLFLKKAPPAIDRFIDRVSLVLMAVAALFLAWFMIQGMMETRADNALSRVLGWQEWPFYIPGIVSLILWAAVSVYQLFADAPPSGEVLPHG